MFRLRPYDFHPDVMVYCRDRPIMFPNGRGLEDDVALITGQQGDSQLLEGSFSHKRSAASPGGRPTRNDKDFQPHWPYLAEPHDNPEEPAPPQLTTKNRILLWVLIIAAALVILLPWFLYFRALSRLRILARQDALPPAAAPPEKPK